MDNALHFFRNKKEIYWHLLIWGLVTTFVCIVDPVQGKLSTQIIATGLIILAYMFVYYSQYFYVLKYYSKNKIKFIVLVILVCITYLSVDFINFYYVLSMFRINDHVDLSSIHDWLLVDLLLFSIVSVISFGSFQNKISILKLKDESTKEKILMINELGFLKNQFNSHTTFNFLNYCYSHFNERSKETADVIEIYSQMLRYTINLKANETVKLEQEIDYLKKFISLKEQLSKGIQIKLFTNGNTKGKYILPRILITFVENAVKHGETHIEEDPIIIKIETNKTDFSFTIHNKKSKGKKLISTQTGQENVKKQLGLFYKNNYNLTVRETEEYYNVLLSINLNHLK